MSECVIITNKPLDDILILLNRFLLQADKYQRLQQDSTIKDSHTNAKNFGRHFNELKNQTKKLEDKRFYNMLKELIDSFGDHYKSTSGYRIFNPNCNIQPVYGTGKAHQPYYNEDLIVGASLILHEQSKVSYRVDFSPDKGLHINFELELKYKEFSLTRNYALTVLATSKRYRINRDNLNNATLLELTQFKFFAKITLDYLCIYPHEINTEKISSSIFVNEGYDTEPEKNIIWLLQRKPFYLDKLFDYLISQIHTKYEEEIANQIISSLKFKGNKQLFVNQLVNNKYIRHIMVDMGAILFKKAKDHDVKARLFAEDVSVDSEQDRTITEKSL